MELTSKSLDWWIRNLDAMSRDIWLWISKETEFLEPDTPCFAVDEGVDLSPGEQEQREADLESDGLSCFVFKDQLEDVVQNLQAQNRNFNQQDLYAAINYYWKNDAFINLGCV